MSEFKFNCPQCGQHLKSDESAAGRQIQCPSCDHLIRIPAVPGQTANYQPESGATWATHVGAGRAAPPENLSIKPNPSSNQKGS